jgi:DNA polymerase sigma
MMESKVAAENMARRPYINWAVKRVTRSLQVLWPRSRTNIFGSNATGMALPTSDVDLVVSLPPVRNLVKFLFSLLCFSVSVDCYLTFLY